MVSDVEASSRAGDHRSEDLYKPVTTIGGSDATQTRFSRTLQSADETR